MTSLTSFAYHRPGSIEETCSILLETGRNAALLSGGTDLLVRIKRSQKRADVLVDLGGIEDLGSIRESAKGLHIGACVTPLDIATNEYTNRYFEAVHQAAGLIGGMQIRNMATIGGSLASGLRCQYHDQSAFWRKTIGPCLADGGESCHADPRKKCVATVACDLPPALMVSDAIVTVYGPDGDRHIPIREFYTDDGLAPIRLNRGELITEILLPWPKNDSIRLTHYSKTRLRRAVDRPLVGLGVSLELGGDLSVEKLEIALCGNGPSVRCVEGLDVFLGSRLDPDLCQSIGRMVANWFSPSPAIRVSRYWRRSVSGTMTRRALESLLNQAADLRYSQNSHIPEIRKS